MDAGGVRKEFFLLIMKELLDPKYGMFRYYEESRLIWFSNKVLVFPSTYLNNLSLKSHIAAISLNNYFEVHSSLPLTM